MISKRPATRYAAMMPRSGPCQAMTQAAPETSKHPWPCGPGWKQQTGPGLPEPRRPLETVVGSTLSRNPECLGCSVLQLRADRQPAGCQRPCQQRHHGHTPIPASSVSSMPARKTGPTGSSGLRPRRLLISTVQRPPHTEVKQTEIADQAPDQRQYPKRLPSQMLQCIGYGHDARQQRQAATGQIPQGIALERRAIPSGNRCRRTSATLSLNTCALASWVQTLVGIATSGSPVPHHESGSAEPGWP